MMDRNLIKKIAACTMQKGGILAKLRQPRDTRAASPNTHTHTGIRKKSGVSTASTNQVAATSLTGICGLGPKPPGDAVSQRRPRDPGPGTRPREQGAESLTRSGFV
jgi:hypothetical protein